MEGKNAKKKQSKNYPFVGIRIDEDMNHQLEKEAKELGVSKSAIIKEAIKHWLLLLNPSDESGSERMIVYKNVFGFCLDNMKEDLLEPLSELVMTNTYRKLPPNRIKKQYKDKFRKMPKNQVIQVFKDELLESRGLGRNWYEVNKLEYDASDDSYYMELTHKISKMFSKFLFINLKDMIENYTYLNPEFCDPFFGDTKLSLYMKVNFDEISEGS